MSLIISEEVLEKIKCSFCPKYLSCGPTKITNSGVACGRCSIQRKGVPSLFDTVAQSVLFPCINRYSGCHNTLFRYDNVKNHEEKCMAHQYIKSYYPCHVCNSMGHVNQSNSLLSLINHYNQKHTMYILKKPKISLTMGIGSCNHYLYCDDMNNCLFLIYVNWNGESVSCNVSLAGMKTKQVMQMVYKTNYKDYCTEFYDNTKVFQISSNELQQQENTVFVEFILKKLDNPEPVLHFEQISNWPKMFIDEEFVKKHGAVKLNKLECKPNSLVLVVDKFSIPIKCSFCKNNFWDCKWTFELYIYKCRESFINLNNCYVCQLCYDRGYTKCSIHDSSFEPAEYEKIDGILFYCRNNCGLFFKFKQLHIHEHKCFGISEEKYVKKNFGLLFPLKADSTTYYIKGNIVECGNFLDKKAMLYMITHDGLKCNIVRSSSRHDFLTFEGSHFYDKFKFCILFRICENGNMREEINIFSIKWSSAKKTFFAVMFKEIAVKTMLVIKN